MTNANNKRKIVNDPVYGFINIPYTVLYDLMEHPYFQRLRRIKQLGVTNLVYPGANHTRFQHALGAMHLMDQAITTLRSKGLDIAETEAEAAMVAILLHDIGHGPYSHALEGAVIPGMSHEMLSLLFMKELDQEFNGQLGRAIEIFEKKYPKKYLCQLVSGQLDMDRLDYLRRDSFFTGVTEGIIGSDRIIKMLHVFHDDLVVEAKGIYSIEKFLLARRLMYWQVYLHKTVISADQLLLSVFRCAKNLMQSGERLFATPDLEFFLKHMSFEDMRNESDQLEVLKHYARLDDDDISVAIKMWSVHPSPVLSKLASNLINRRLFRIRIQNTPFDEDIVQSFKNQVTKRYNLKDGDADYFVCTGTLSNHAYDHDHGGIQIMLGNNPVDITEASDLDNLFGMSKVVEKYFLCYPKELDK